MRRALLGKFRWVLPAVALVLLAGGYGVRRIRAAEPGPATVQVVQGDLEVLVKSRGEIKALRSITLSAPTTITDVKLVTLSKGGSTVKAGDVVAQIDPTQEQDRLKQQQSALKQADAEMEKVRAQARMDDEQDRLDLAQAQFDVESARLDVSKGEIVSAIDAGKAKLALANTERKLEEVKQRIVQHKHTHEADADQVVQKRKKAQNDVKQAQANLQRMTLRSPIAGVVNLMPNWSASTGWQSAPEFKAGDRAWPGASIIEIPDMTSLVVDLNVQETDRGRIAVGQTVSTKVEAFPDKLIPGKIQRIGAVAEVSYAAWPPQKNFRAFVGLENPDARLRPGMSAGADIVVDRLRGVTLIPVRASFERAGKVIAYVKTGGSFEVREIVLGYKGEKQVEVLRGLKPGETVALEEPPATALPGERGGS